MIHPLVSIISFIVFSASVSLGQTTTIITALFMLLMLILLSKQLPSSKAWLMIKRLKIFFISILIIYLWFTPGQLVFPAWDEWSPTYEGVIQGLERIFALCLLVVAVESLLRLMNRSDLLCGLYYLAAPFSHLGFSREKFMIRLVLTLEAVTDFGVKKQSSPKRKARFKEYVETVSDRLAMRIKMADSDDAKNEAVEFEVKPLPHWYQWLLPIGIGLIFMSVR